MPEWIVPPEEAGKKLIAFLTERLGNRHSARFLKRKLESHDCQINGRTEHFASYIVAKGDYINFQLKEIPTDRSLQIKKIEPIRILYEDEAILIYDKPPGINSDEKGILNVLKTYSPHLQLIHRLDRDTTGVLLFAKSPCIFEKMVKEFKELKVQKCYLALVDGNLENKKGSIDNYLGKKHVYEGQTVWGAVSKEKGLHAHTDWVLVKQGKQAALLYCFPLTGRTHQIRVHLSSMGHPILGDFQYCKKFGSDYRPVRYLLHAYKISFIHPLTGIRIEIQAPIPEDFLQAQKDLFE